LKSRVDKKRARFFLLDHHHAPGYYFHHHYRDHNLWMLSSRNLQIGIALTALALYGIARVERPYIEPSFIRWSLPSLLFAPACFSLVGLLPIPCGGCGGAVLPRKYIWAGIALAVLGFEIIGPLMGRGTGDWKDGVALVLGAWAYLLITDRFSPC